MVSISGKHLTVNNASAGQAPFALNSELLKEIEAMRQTYEQEQSTRQQIEWDRGRLRKDVSRSPPESL